MTSLENSDSLWEHSSHALQSPGSGRHHSYLVLSKVLPEAQILQRDCEDPQPQVEQVAQVGSVAWILHTGDVQGSLGASQDCCVPETYWLQHLDLTQNYRCAEDAGCFPEIVDLVVRHCCKMLVACKQKEQYFLVSRKGANKHAKFLNRY